MIDVVTPDRYAAFQADLEEMHRLRHDVFIRRLKWNVRGENGLERDEFDDQGPTYLLSRNHRGRVVGAWRMLPTTGRYMLKDVFPVLLEGQPPPAEPTIWEGSRFVVRDDLRTRNGLTNPGRITSEIFCGVTEFSLAMGIKEVLCVYERRIARILPLAGCQPVWQSQPHRLGSNLAVLGRFAMSREFLAGLRERGGISNSVIGSAPWRDQEEKVA
ncbi:MAG: acyl-homoserine-lactone synthase [Alphaproteobacteria bacterium]|nr:acyl-homoserine-lactone synthase [Alphaproteobacteria bacterium]